MKKLIVIPFFLILVGLAHAQNYHKFRLGLGLGAPSVGNGLLTIEPAYRINDAVAIGLRAEQTSVLRHLDIAMIGSLSVNGQFYLNDHKFRPFLGFGAGIFKCTSVNDLAPNETKPGFYPRAGFDFKHFTFALDYNIIPSTESPGYGSLNNSYLGIRFGWFIWGGKKMM